MRQHPNATAAYLTGICATGLVWLLGRLGVHIDADTSVAIATILIAAVLFIGRNGLQGTWRRIWKGK